MLTETAEALQHNLQELNDTLEKQGMEAIGKGLDLRGLEGNRRYVMSK